MSFDLCVWYSSKPLSNEEAGRKYIALCEGDEIESLIEPHDNIARFIAEVTAKFPQIDDVPEDEVDNCPWNIAFDQSPGHCIMCIAWSQVEEIAPYVVELAENYGLVCYDPQVNQVYLPSQLNGAA